MRIQRTPTILEVEMSLDGRCRCRCRCRCRRRLMRGREAMSTGSVKGRQSCSRFRRSSSIAYESRGRGEERRVVRWRNGGAIVLLLNPSKTMERRRGVSQNRDETVSVRVIRQTLNASWCHQARSLHDLVSSVRPRY